MEPVFRQYDRHAGCSSGHDLPCHWFGAWDNTIMGMWMDNCINKMLNCSGGSLGNGKMMKQYAGFTWLASPRLTAVPQG